MKTWNKGTALLAVSLVLGSVPAIWGQGTAPTPFGPARMPEPVPCAPSPPLAPGPLGPLDAPPGPPACLSLPANHSGAFQCENFLPECGIYAHAGAMALKRQGLGNLAFGSISDTVLDTGATSPVLSAPAVDLHDLDPHMSWGIRGTVGYLFNDSAVEVTGFVIPDNSRSSDTINQGRLNLPFRNVPVGFEGDNNLFKQADRVQTTLSSRIWNVELNYRYNDVAFTGVEVIFGVRYLDQRDRLGIFTDDDGLTNVTANGSPDPTRQATYEVSAQNRLIAPQLGFEYQHALFCKYISAGMTAKGAWGPNFASVENSLRRGDGLVGLDVKQNEVIFSHMYDLNFFLDFHVLDRVTLRGGYNLMWLCQWATGPSNLNFNLAAPTSPGFEFNRNGSIFYHGPMAELEILF